ncbi:hypothetical protein [Salipiger sp. PrR002]|uniref:hypothetical protein n=1 Tax=Salipiger sp. PrR002 TaxID=2706489 RepID=UPI0013B98398|nr:hypothetical protein [Salipiger sp. PrR002]NDV97685.1 hypothetical protein [Salipiger sp. PrR002]NDW55176.1 hypothetical protein [Salipiger sp. PrR004]
MSDPVTNVEIEDVLSSIRRLVSEDSRAPQPQADTRPAVPERLVLTPALRVPDAAAEPKQPPATPLHPAFSEEPGPDEMRLTRRLRPSEEEMSTPAWRRASFETVRTEERQEAEEARLEDAPETAELRAELPSSLPAPEALSEPPLAAEPAPEEMAEPEEAPFIEVAEEDEPEDQGASIADFFAAKLRETPRATPPEPVAEITPKEGSLARKIAELEEMIARSTTEFEPETGEAAPEAIFRHQPVTSPEPAPAAEAPQAPNAPQAELDEDDAELASRPMPEPELVDRPFETDVTGEPDIDDEEDAPFAFRRSSSERAPQPEIAEPDAESAAEPELASDVPEVPKPSARRPVKILRNPVWQRSQSNLRREAEELAAAPSAEAPAPEPEEAAAPAQVEAEVASAPEPVQEPVTEPQKADEGGDLLAALDQETLRKLVAEVVREELQGAIGERVSRNLRKLVRNEIQRIAMSADVD